MRGRGKGRGVSACSVQGIHCTGHTLTTVSKLAIIMKALLHFAEADKTQLWNLISSYLFVWFSCLYHFISFDNTIPVITQVRRIGMLWHRSLRMSLARS